MSKNEEVDVTSNKIDHSDYEWAMALNRLTMRLVGLWPEEEPGRLKIMNNVHVASFVFLMIFGLLFPQLYALKLVIAELSLVADNIMPSIAIMISITKVILLHLHQRNLRFVMACIKSDYLSEKHDWERTIMLNEAKRARIFTICGYFMVISSIIGALFGPLVGFSFRVINNITDRGDRYFPEQTYYPYSFEKTPYFEITYAIQLLSAAIATVCFSGPVTLFNVIVLHNCGLLKILSIKINKLAISQDVKVQSHNGRSDFWRQLKNLVETHIRIITIVSNIEDAYKSLILAHIFGLSTMMCCLGFQMLNVIDSTDDKSTFSQFVILTIILVTVLLHTFLYCFAGEQLASSSEELCRNIYYTRWYTWTPKQSMSLMLLLIRTKEPLHLTAGKVANLNLASFANILKTSAGYISMLITVRDK